MPSPASADLWSCCILVSVFSPTFVADLSPMPPHHQVHGLGDHLIFFTLSILDHLEVKGCLIKGSLEFCHVLQVTGLKCEVF